MKPTRYWPEVHGDAIYWECNGRPPIKARIRLLLMWAWRISSPTMGRVTFGDVVKGGTLSPWPFRPITRVISHSKQADDDR
jgi:hypothetical protein